MSYLKDELKGFVPVEQAKNIIKKVAQGSTLMKLSTVEPMQSDTKKLNVLTDGAGAYWVGEGERIQTSKSTWIHPEMKAKKLAVIIPVTKEKLDDSTINVFGELEETIAEAFYKKIDSAGLFGIDSPFATNIMKSIETSGNKVALGTNGEGKIDLDVSDAMALVEDEDYDVTSFVARKGVKNTLRKLRDANGNQLFADGVNGTEFYNEPIEFVSKGVWDKDKAEVIGGDFKKYSLLGIRAGIQYEILKEATLQGTVDEDGKPISLAEQDLIAIKATMRLGYLVVKDEAFCAVVPSTNKEESNTTQPDQNDSNE
jgi:HK97 family phage major capsid protein